jgi:hypothetical protein
MGLITRPKTPAFTEQENRMPCEDPILHSERFCQEAADELDRDASFQRTLDAALRPTVEENRELEKRRERKAAFWLAKMAKSGVETDWDRLVEDMRKHDPRSADFLAKLVAHARASGLLGEDEE